MEWTFNALLPLVGIILGIIGKGIYDTRFKKIDDAAKIRAELWEELKSLRSTLKEVEDQLHEAKRKEIDMDIACSRCVARLDECAEVIGLILEAEEKLDQGDVRRAKALLSLIERDRQMRRELNLG